MEIWNYIADDCTFYANAFVDEVHHHLSLIAEMPGMGRRRPELGAGIRSYPVGSYVLLYRPIEDGISVVRILHTSRDLGDFGEMVDLSDRF